MNLILILVIILVVVVLLEMSKHFLFTTIAKTIFIFLILGIIFILVINNIGSENPIKTSNKFVQTGASIAEVIEEQDLFESIKEKISELKEDIMERAT